MFGNAPQMNLAMDIRSAALGRSPQDLAFLFRDGTGGLWYDIDPRYVYQDSAGTTAGAVNQPVGLVLDRSQGLRLGANIAPGGGVFDSSSGWTLGTGWTVSGGVAQRIDTGSWSNLTAAGVATSGKWYKVSVNIKEIAGSVVIGAGWSSNNFTTVGVKTLTIKASSSDFHIQCASGTVTVDDVSIRELPGHHATQSTATARPILDGSYYATLDLVDDKVAVTLPAITGQIVIATTLGIWIDDLNFAGGTFEVGIGTYTGGPANLFSTIGSNIIGICVVDKTMTASEQSRVVSYYTRKGSPGLITLGDDLVVNGTFDSDTAWNKDATWSIAGGKATSSGGTGGLTTSSQIMSGGTHYFASLDVIPNSGSVLVREGSNGNSFSASSSGAAGMIEAGDASSNVGRLYIYSAPLDGYIDNVSLREVILP